MLQITPLYSGSKGNATLLSINGARYLLDAGGTYKNLVKHLKNVNTYPDHITSVFITHEHADHDGAAAAQFNNRATLKPFEFQSLANGSGWIMALPAIHDVSCVSYIFGDDYGNKAALITDTGDIDCDALDYYLGCNAILIEANHDIDTTVVGPYPDELKERVMDTHLSNEQAGDFIELIRWPGLKHVVGIHLSATNNSESLASYELSRGADGCQVQICKQSGNSVNTITLI